MHISDLHIGSLIKYKYVKNVVNIVNSLNPNLIAMTGDFVDGSVESLQRDIAPLAELKAKYGKFFATGNHEYYSGANSWIEKFKELGVDVLLNEHRILQLKDDKIAIAGVTDYSTINMPVPNASDVMKAVNGISIGMVTILLAHQPASYKVAHQAGVNLQLSGHTHAGQYFPFNILIDFFHRYFKGLNLHKGMWIYINKGTGYWGPPLRSWSPSEITLIILKQG